MQLSENLAIINEDNMNGLKRLYGSISIDELSRIVNKFVAVAIDEIIEDENR